MVHTPDGQPVEATPWWGVGWCEVGNKAIGTEK